VFALIVMDQEFLEPGFPFDQFHDLQGGRPLLLFQVREKTIELIKKRFDLAVFIFDYFGASSDGGGMPLQIVGQENLFLYADMRPESGAETIQGASGCGKVALDEGGLMGKEDLSQSFVDRFQLEEGFGRPAGFHGLTGDSTGSGPGPPGSRAGQPIISPPFPPRGGIEGTADHPIMAEIQTETTVLGAGPAGYLCAIRLAQYGKKVVCVEEGRLGGTCLNVGCIPSKALIVAGNFLEEARSATEMGITVGEPAVDLARMIAWKQGIVEKLTGGIGMLFKKRGIHVVRGRGRLLGPGSVEVEGPKGGITRIKARDVVIATGSEPVTFPGWEFGERIWSSTEALSPARIPGHLLVVGGGYIGMELGTFYAHLGCKVTIVEATGSILPGTEADLSRLVARKAKKARVEILTGSFAREWKEKDGRVEVRVETDGESRTIATDQILMTVGRRPCSRGIGLENAGLTPDKAGFLEVDAQRRTRTPHVYAIGDVAGQPMLAHKGFAEGLAAAAVLAGKQGAAYDVKAVPAVIFTDPEIATVGMTKAQAREAGREVSIGRFSFGANGRALSLRKGEGFIKVVADKGDDTVLGVQMVGPEVSELISEATLAIEAGLTSEDLALTVHAHPTLPEVFQEACEDVHGMSPHSAK